MVITSFFKAIDMQHPLSAPDARFFQVIFQAFFLSYGIAFLHWDADWLHYACSIGSCLLFNYLFECRKRQSLLPLTGDTGIKLWGFSTMISAFSLCLLLKTGHWYTSILAAFFSVGSKYFFKVEGKHIFNPSAFGIILTLLITNDAWLSPAQWGSDVVLFFTIITLGTIVVTRVQKLDVSIAFLLTFIALLYWRQVYVLGWPADHFVHSISTGSLLLFSFFMISDPRTSPDHPLARIIWAMAIAGAAFYLSAFQFKHNTPLWVLVAAAPLLPVLNKMFRAETFHWTSKPLIQPIHSTIKNIIMKPLVKKGAAFIFLLAMIGQEAIAFCGFYVSKADGTLKNKTSQVILVRDGNSNVITMFNDFQGNFKDFAMVVPVPVVLKRKDIKVVDQQIFHTLNEYSKPRLVEYYDEDPCMRYERRDFNMAPSSALQEVVVSGYGVQRRKELGVKIEAKYLVGEYDILILSAKESSGLKIWLNENGYKVPPSADEVLQPYIKSNLKFFVVKVNEQEKRKLPGNFLRPIQISFHSPKFMLPIRLGMANADGDQDMIVYAFTKEGRVECTNYRTVELPTSKNIPLFVKDNFGSFYSNLFQYQWKREGKSVAMLEYAWDVSPQNFMKCDPCVATAPAEQDLVQAGVWWINRQQETFEDEEPKYGRNVHFTRLHVRYNRHSFPQDLQFQVTPNREAFQARYIVTHPAKGSFDCAAGKAYLNELKLRRQKELEMLKSLTGKGYSDWDVAAIDEEKNNWPEDISYTTVATTGRQKQKKGISFLFATIGVFGLGLFVNDQL